MGNRLLALTLPRDVPRPRSSTRSPAQSAPEIILFKIVDGKIMLKYCAMLATVSLTLTVLHADERLPEGAGRDILEKKCGSCHEPQVVTANAHDADGWHGVVAEMISLGAEINEEETKTLVEYLVKNWPDKRSKLAEDNSTKQQVSLDKNRE
jgi:hypothetical protein